MKYFKVAGACVNQTPLSWDSNTAHLISAIEAARKEKVAILCLPELAISGYGCEDTFFSGYVLRQSLAALDRIREASAGMIVSVGLPMEVENCLYNVCCLMQDQVILGFVAKQELAGDGVHYEPRWFKRWPKNLSITVDVLGGKHPFGDLIFEIDGIRLGFEICEDAWNGVRPAQDHYLNNVDVILNPSASHFAFGKTMVRELLVTETSRAYSCAYIYSNLLGNESGRIIYDGEIIIAQGGKLLARNKRFSYEDFQIITASLDVQAIRRQKKKSFNFQPVIPNNLVHGRGSIAEAPEPGVVTEEACGDRFSKEEEFYHALTLGLFDYMRKSRSRGFTISLSGGADSSCCAVLVSECYQRAYKELGEEKFREKLSYLNAASVSPQGQAATLNVPPGEARLSAQFMQDFLTCVYQGTGNSSDATLTSARELAAGLGATFYLWNVQPLLTQYEGMVEASLSRDLNFVQDDIAMQNIQARLRSPGVWMVANVKNALLLTTSNRSEAAVGYATMDGDTSGGLAPLGGIDKAFLLKWLRWAQSHLGISSLSFVNNLQPTAELRPPDQTQTDEEDLMPYPVLDQIERNAIRDYKSPLEVFKTLRGLEPDTLLKAHIRKFFTLWARNQWKRERYAPSFHLDDQNLDPKTWCRFPILSGSFVKELAEMDACQ